MDEKKSAYRRRKNGIGRTIRRWMLKNGMNKRAGDLLKENGVELAKGLGIFAITFVFARSSPAFGAYPFGTAFFCASGRAAPFAFLGLLTASLFAGESALQLFLIACALFLIRILLYRRMGEGGKTFALFGEPTGLKVSCAAGASLLASLYRYAFSGFLMYDLFGMMFEVVLTPVLTYLYAAAFVPEKRVGGEKAVLILLISFTFALRAFSPFGFSMAVLFAALVGMLFASGEGELKGGLYALLCGLAASPLYSPVLALMAVVCGLLRKFGSAVSSTLSCIAAVLGGLYVGGVDSLTDFAPDMLSAAILYLPVAQTGLLAGLFRRKAKEEALAEESQTSLIGQAKRRETRQKTEALSRSLVELSEMFGNLAERAKRPTLSDIFSICEEEFDRTCQTCPMQALCWEKDQERTCELVKRLAESMEKKGFADEKELPDYIKTRCLNLPRLVENLNGAAADMVEQRLKGNREEVFAMDYRSMARLLLESVGEKGEEIYRPDRELSEKLQAKMREIRLPAKSIYAFGGRRKQIVAGDVELSRVTQSVGMIRRAFEEVCGFPLTDPTFDLGQETVAMTLSAARRFELSFAMAGGKKQGETLNGDVLCRFENREEYAYFLLSDGMGSGREAAMTSRICGVFLEKMLTAGNSKALTLDMLNDFLRSREAECSTTVDLLEIDLLSGRASFVKSGSASSYVIRGDKLFRISSRSMPVGIAASSNAEEITFDLLDGDCILLMSDGVGNAASEDSWVASMVAEGRDCDPESLCEEILHRAGEKNDRSDDMTVGIVRVREKRRLGMKEQEASDRKGA